MKIRWLGHAAFLITAGSGVRIITDPYTPTDTLRYGEINEAADIVTVSHEHGDHNNAAAVRGSPVVVKSSASVRGIDFLGIATHHDDAQGKTRGANTVFCFTVDGIRVCHLGDLGHVLTAGQVKQAGKVDILLVPVGGFYTIDAAAATRVADQLRPKVIIPMHYKNDRCVFPIAGVDGFLKGKKNVQQPDATEAEFTAGKLPVETRVLVLKPAK